MRQFDFCFQDLISIYIGAKELYFEIYHVIIKFIIIDSVEIGCILWTKQRV